MIEKNSSNEINARALTARIRGRVQNVGFRAFVRDLASRMGLRGYTRNLPDGTVEVLATGDRLYLEQLLSQLKQGPRAARVDHVEHSWLDHEPEGLGARFEVRG